MTECAELYNCSLVDLALFGSFSLAYKTPESMLDINAVSRRIKRTTKITQVIDFTRLIKKKLAKRRTYFPRSFTLRHNIWTAFKFKRNIWTALV